MKYSVALLVGVLIAAARFGEITGNPAIELLKISPILQVYRDVYRENITLLTSINTDGESTLFLNATEMQQIKIRCDANYPVRLTFEGEGFLPIYGESNRMEDVDPTSTHTHFERYSEESTIYWLSASFTRKYICQSMASPERRSSLTIFVPSQDLFINDTPKENIRTSADSKDVQIPCGVSHPNVSVTLSKLNENGTELRRVDVVDVEFHPTKGFQITKGDHVDDLRGKYVCTARYGDNVRVIQHIVKNQEQNKTCALECSENANCEITPSGGHQYCGCKLDEVPAVRTFGSSNMCFRECMTNDDCPSNQSCLVRDHKYLNFRTSTIFSNRKDALAKVCGNPCILSELILSGPCGSSSVCTVENHFASCSNGASFSSVQEGIKNTV